MTDTTSFTIESPEALAPFIARERQADEHKVVSFRARSARTSGVSFGGMSDVTGPPERRSDGEIEAAAAAKAAKHLAWLASPRGRYYSACLALRRAGYEHTADRALSAYARGFSPLSPTPCPREMASAMADLMSVPPNDHTAAKAAAVACVALVAIAFEAAAEEAA